MRKYFLLSVFALVLLGSAHSVRAASVYFGVHAPEAYIGVPTEVGVFVSAEGEELNAFEGDIVVPEEYFEINAVRDGSSMVSFWMDKPRAEKGVVHFSGIVPGGYSGNDGLLFSVMVAPHKVGIGTIESARESLLLNNGEGTPAVVQRAPARLTIQEGGIREVLPATTDTEPPEVFVVERTQDRNVFDNQWFITFATQDKRSGIARYEVKEGWGVFREAQSPYVLRNQRLDSRVMVRAIDSEGNVRESVLAPLRARAWYYRFDIFGIIIAVLFFALLAWRRLVRKIRGR